MDGTPTPDVSSDAEISAYIAQIERYRLAAEQDVAEPNGDTAELRRAARRRSMEVLRADLMGAAHNMAEVIAGRLPPEHCPLFAHARDPLASLANISRCIVQVAMAEDRFDESAEERVARLAAEAEAALSAKHAEEAARADDERRLRKAENRRHVHSSVRAISLSGLNLQWRDREDLLARLFDELDAHDAFDADPADIIADVCVRLGITIKDPPKQAADHLARRDRMVALARTHLEGLRGPHIIDLEDAAIHMAASSAPPAHAQGPP